MITISHHAKYVGQRSFRSIIIVRTYAHIYRTHKHTADPLHYLDHKVVVNNTNKCSK